MPSSQPSQPSRWLAGATLAAAALLLLAPWTPLAHAAKRRGPIARPVGRAGAAAGVAVAAVALNTVGDLTGRSGPFETALNLGDASANASRDDCVWRRGMDRDRCPDPQVLYVLHSGSAEAPRREVVDMRQRDWLRRSAWEPSHDNVLLIHGYGGGEEDVTVSVLRGAYLRNGRYNVFTVDWGALARLPCYPAAVHNMRTVARCTGRMLGFLRDSGMPVDRTTCVGHSLGAHVCGLIAHYLTFRMQRIVALDPARPLVRLQNKVGPADATAVHVLHTNAGHYGEAGRVGHVDFCINGGRMQPFCENASNPELCSHARSVCYLAESVSTSTARIATPCGRRCPSGVRQTGRLSDPVYMGQHTPLNAVGSFCVANLDEPYCPQDPRCCGKSNTVWTAPEEP